MESFQDHQRMYEREHSTLGCKITHMFGVPLIAASAPLFFFQAKLAAVLFIVGWILQFIGHYVFERNKPVFFGNPLNPMTYCSALVFVGQEWLKLLTGKPLVQPSKG